MEWREADTVGEAGGRSEIWTATAWGMQESGVGELPGFIAAGRSETGKATSVVADEAEAGGRHGARPGVRERFVGRQENSAGESPGVGGEEGGGTTWSEQTGKRAQMKAPNGVA